DGWETIRRLRATELGRVPVAVVSANAFDQGLDNDVGLPAADFLVKPVRLPTLLDWLGRRLDLQWLGAEAGPVVVEPEADEGARPATAQLSALRELVRLGYVRGVVRQL